MAQLRATIPSRQAKEAAANTYLAFANDAATRYDILGMAVNLAPFNGETYNNSTAVIEGRGDYRLMHFSLLWGTWTFDLNPYSYAAFWLWQLIPGYTGYTDIAPGAYPLTTFALAPGESTWNQHPGGSPVSDSDYVDRALRGGAEVSFYRTPLCCWEKEPPIRQKLGISVWVYDCPSLSFDPDGVYYTLGP